MKTPLVSLALAGAALAGAQTISIIPQPVKVEPKNGRFEMRRSTRISITSETEELGKVLQGYLSPATGFELPLSHNGGAGSIELRLDRKLSNLGPEGYQVIVDHSHVQVKGFKRAGVFYGLQTLRQLLPPDIFRKSPLPDEHWDIPCVEIEDSPRFGWRGAMVDSSRHFMPKEFIFKFIDLLALHKLNHFHMHLTDDNGWRIEIKRYPNLTAKSSSSDFSAMNPDGATRSINQQPGGFYTQDDIREIVAYAAQNYITVIPEIELPGHSKAAIDAYPELGNAMQIREGPDKAFANGNFWDNVYNVDDGTIKFLKDVLDEVMSLFPSEYIHIGGDEVWKEPWKKNPRAQDRMKSLGLKTAEELQSWFIKQFDDYLGSKGRRLIGWDEILEGGLAPKATVMSWRGMDGGIAAAKAKHDVVMAPTTYTYFDYYQGKLKSAEPKAIGGYIPLETVYSFDPVPPALTADEAKYVLGGQFQLWSEFIPHPRHMEYMAYPRGCALAETVWSPKQTRSWSDFQNRLVNHLDRLRAIDVNFRPLKMDPEPTAKWKTGDVAVTFGTREWDITKAVSGTGSYSVLFQYTSGACRLEIQSVEILVDGTAVSKIDQTGFTGSADKNNKYRVDIKGVLPASRVTLRANVRSDGGTDTNGDIYVWRNGT